MKLLCGTDIVEIDRIQDALSKSPFFAEKVFTRAEIDYCESKNKSKYQSYAARFAAKEAVAKAFGTGICDSLGWKDIEVLNSESGKPYVNLSDKAKKLLEQLKGSSIELSLSHSDNYAVAFAVITTAADEQDSR